MAPQTHDPTEMSTTSPAPRVHRDTAMHHEDEHSSEQAHTHSSATSSPQHESHVPHSEEHDHDHSHLPHSHHRRSVHKD